MHRHTKQAHDRLHRHTADCTSPTNLPDGFVRAGCLALKLILLLSIISVIVILNTSSNSNSNSNRNSNNNHENINWLRTNGGNANAVAAKVMNLDRLGKG